MNTNDMEGPTIQQQVDAARVQHLLQASGIDPADWYIETGKLAVAGLTIKQIPQLAQYLAKHGVPTDPQWRRDGHTEDQDSHEVYRPAFNPVGRN